LNYVPKKFPEPEFLPASREFCVKISGSAD